MFSFLSGHCMTATEALEPSTINQNPSSVGSRSNSLRSPFGFHPSCPHSKVKMQAYKPYKNHYVAWCRTNSSPALETPLENMKHATAILREMNHMVDEGEDEDEQVQLDTSDNPASVEAPSIASGPSKQPNVTMSTSIEDPFNNMANDLMSLKHSITSCRIAVSIDGDSRSGGMPDQRPDGHAES
ncbi:hypothetical protein B0H10DRAFT_2187183 [Mycena sp. CBHHK59/15]|nr:hypothetical protein B0H10DRAFT_2187183 [Mycena sp. CBHHK59/15]